MTGVIRASNGDEWTYEPNVGYSGGGLVAWSPGKKMYEYGKDPTELAVNIEKRIVRERKVNVQRAAILATMIVGGVVACKSSNPTLKTVGKIALFGPPVAAAAGFMLWTGFPFVQIAKQLEK